MVKWWIFNSFQALKLILQPGSDDELEVGHYESSNESVEDEDFAEDVPKIDGNPIKMVNWTMNVNDGGEENCFVYSFQSSQKTRKQRCWQTGKHQ